MPINPQTGQWESTASTTPNFFGGLPDNTDFSGVFGGSGSNPFASLNDNAYKAPPLAAPSNGLASVAQQVQAGLPNYTNNTAANPAPNLAPPPPATGANSAALVDPMSFFRTDVGGYNPQQYATAATQAGVNSFLPGSTAGQTQTGGPFGVPEQAITNFGGINMNTGLIQNLRNQYGDAQALKMIQDEVAASKAQGGKQWSLTNDASLRGYEGVRPDVASLPTVAPPSTNGNYNAAAYQSPAGMQQAQQVATQNATAGLTPNPTTAAGVGTGNSNGIDTNSLMGILTLLMLMGGFGGNNNTTAAQPPAANAPVNRNNYLYSLFY